jgi:hypothetical protein
MLAPSRSRDIGAAARGTIGARFSLDRMVASFEEPYERELAGTKIKDQV